MPHYKLSVIAIRISSNFEIDPDFETKNLVFLFQFKPLIPI
jgi:hypothetical protein